MDELSGSTLLDALRTCDEHGGARIGIACARSASAKLLIESLWNEIVNGRMPGWEIGRELDGVNATLRKKVKSEYSTIEIFTPFLPQNIRGRSFHQVLYEKFLNPSFLDELCWCERLSFGLEENLESEVLDEFLNSFKIV